MKKDTTLNKLVDAICSKNLAKAVNAYCCMSAQDQKKSLILPSAHIDPKGDKAKYRSTSTCGAYNIYTFLEGEFAVRMHSPGSDDARFTLKSNGEGIDLVDVHIDFTIDHRLVCLDDSKPFTVSIPAGSIDQETPNKLISVPEEGVIVKGDGGLFSIKVEREGDHCAVTHVYADNPGPAVVIDGVPFLMDVVNE